MKIKPWALVTLLLGAAYFLLPLLAVFMFSLRGTKDELGFSAYVRVFQDPNFINSFLFSLKVAAMVIVLSFVLVIPTAIHVRLHFPRLRQVFDVMVNLPFTIPVIVLAFGLIRVYSSTLSSSVFLLVAGSVVICLPYVYRLIDSGLESIKLKTLTEAAASLGASWPRTLFTVILPNLRTPLISAASIVFAMVMGELTLSLMLAWPAFGPYMALVGRGLAYEPAALAVMSFALTWASIALLHFAGRKQPTSKTRDNKK